MADPGRLDELKRKFDENPKRYFAPLANEYRKAGDAELAIELCRTYLPKQPGHMSGYIVYGQALHDAGQTEESAAVFKQALSLDPENIIALRHLGDIARNAGDNVGAMRWYGKVLELDPRNEEISAVLTALNAPGTPAFGPAAIRERQAPPTIRPEPAPDASAVRLEDIVSEPDVAQTPFVAEEPVPAPAEPAQLFEDPSDEPFEVTEWPKALDSSSDEQDDADSASHPVLEGPWHSDVESDATADQAASLEEHAPPRLADFMPEEDAAFAPTPEELGESSAMQLDAAPSIADAAPETRSGGNSPVGTTSEPSAPESAVAAAPEPAAAPDAVRQPESAGGSPFVTETMAELYLSQGLRGEALAIYRQLAVRRDDPDLRRKIAELEAAPPEPASESVRAFFERIGARRPNERVEMASQRGSSLGALFGSAQPDAGDVSAAQRLSGAFGSLRSAASRV